MPELDDITELRGVLEKGFAAGINDTFTVFSRLNSVVSQKDTPRFELTVAIGGTTGAKRGFPADRTIRFTHWNFTAQFKVITRPASALKQNAGESDEAFKARVNANNGLHAQLVAHLRSYTLTAAQLSWNDVKNFPNHYIAEALKHAGNPSTQKPQEGYEETTLSHTGVIGVRSSAWPVAPVIPDIVPIPSQPIQDDSGINIQDDTGQSILSD